MRRVEISKFVQPHRVVTKEPDGFGWFHGFGVNYEEFGSQGPAQPFTCAIVERQDGTVSLLSVELIRFMETAIAEPNQ